MLIEIVYNRTKQVARIKVIYNVVMFEDGKTHRDEELRVINNCRLSHTGEAIAFIENSAPHEVEISSPHVVGIYPKSLTILTFE